MSSNHWGSSEVNDVDKLMQNPEELAKRVLPRRNWLWRRNVSVGMMYILPMELVNAGASPFLDFEIEPRVHTDTTFPLTELQCEVLPKIFVRLSIVVKCCHDSPLAGDAYVNFLSYLSVIVHGPKLERLSLAFDESDHNWALRCPFFNVGGLLAHHVWPSLQYLSLGCCKFHLIDLQQFLSRVQRSFRIRLRRCELKNGTWLEVLDLVRTSIDDELSSIIDAQGAEKDRMHPYAWDDVFGRSETFRVVPNLADQYIRKLIEVNPLSELA